MNCILDVRLVILVFCYFFLFCIGFYCCVNVLDFNMFFSVYIFVDFCNYLFIIGIEKFIFNKLFDYYIFGKYWFMKYFFFLICGYVYKIVEILLDSFYRLVGLVNVEIDLGV